MHQQFVAQLHVQVCVMADPATGDLNADPRQDIDALLQNQTKRAEILQRLGTVKFRTSPLMGWLEVASSHLRLGCLQPLVGHFRFQMGLLH